MGWCEATAFDAAASAIIPALAAATFPSIIPMKQSSIARMEPGTRAEEAYSHGLVLRAEGRIAASAERLQAAFETWRAIGFEWRAARAALELTELDAGDVFRLALRKELQQRPNSIFSVRARLVA